MIALPGRQAEGVEENDKIARGWPGRPSGQTSASAPAGTSNIEAMPAKRRVAIYARISTLDGGRDTRDQLRRLRARYERAGHEVVAEYVDHAGDGEGLAELLAATARDEFDLVLFWSLD